MSLNYGFGYSETNQEKIAAWTGLYNALSEKDQEFYNEFLPWILMFTDMGEVTAETIPHIVARLKLHSPDYYKATMKLHGIETSLNEYMTRFIGFTANICTITSAEFTKKLLKNIKKDLPPLAQKDVYRICKSVSTLTPA